MLKTFTFFLKCQFVKTRFFSKYDKNVKHVGLFSKTGRSQTGGAGTAPLKNGYRRSTSGRGCAANQSWLWAGSMTGARPAIDCPRSVD